MSIFLCTFAAAKVVDLSKVQILIDDDMSRCTAEEVARLLPLVSAQRREQALRYKHVFGQYCCLRSWEMLNELLNEGIGKLEKERLSELMDKWSYDEYGKPSLISSLSHSLTPYFSISHCKEGIAVVVAEDPVGIDIEGIRHWEDDLIEQVMNEAEKSISKSRKSKEERDREFTRLWTQKEAVLKAQGTGIQSFEQLKNVLTKVESGKSKGKRQKWNVESFEKEKYIYSIAYGKLHCLGTEIPSTDI